jgi:hypothetical protein
LNVLMKETFKWNKGRSLRWAQNCFFIFSCLWMEYVIQYDTLWLSKNYMLYIMCTLNVLNPFNSTIESRLIFTKNCHAHYKSFLHEFRIAKRLPPEKVHCTLLYLLCVIIFCLKWFTSNMFSPTHHAFVFIS